MSNSAGKPQITAITQEPFLRTRMPELDSIRGIAVLLVVLFHEFGFAYGLDGLSGIRKLFVGITCVGWVGVNLFFVLSGFLITGILLDTKSRRDYYKRFYARRALRILPLYYAVLMLLVALARARLVDRHVSWAFVGFSSVYMANLTELFGVPIQYGVLWSLAVEEHFYLLWPAVVRFVSRRGIAVTGTVISALCLGLRMLTYVLGGRAGIGYTWLVADGLAMGAVLAALIRGPLGTRHGIRQIIWCSFAISFVLLAAGAPFGIFWGRTFLGVTVRPTAINLFFTAIIATALRVGTSPWKAIVNPRPLRFLGDISYCIYLVHMLMFELVNHILIRLIPSLPSGKGHFGVMVLRFSLATSITILIAVLSRRYFEGPFLRLKAYFEEKTDFPKNKMPSSVQRLPHPGEDLQNALEIAQ